MNRVGSRLVIVLFAAVIVGVTFIAAVVAGFFVSNDLWMPVQAFVAGVGYSLVVVLSSLVIRKHLRVLRGDSQSADAARQRWAMASLKGALNLEFVLVGECVTLAGGMEEAFRNLDPALSPADTERAINHLHVSLQFSELLANADLSLDDARFLGDSLSHYVHGVLDNQFPERHFVTEVLNIGPNDDDFDLIVRWYQVPAPN